MSEDNVALPCLAYQEMAKKWELITDLLGGTLAMREAKTKWLPKEQAESDGNYKIRLGRSVLFEALKNAIDRIVSRPFSKPITVGELPENYEWIVSDADGCGMGISQLARKVFQDLVTYGKAHLLVDFTAIPENSEALSGGGAPATIADEQARGARATIAHVAVPSLIGWEFDGPRSEQLAEIRLKSSQVEKKPGSQYEQTMVERVRVIRRDSFQIWKLEDNGDHADEWKLESEGLMSLGEVPLVTIYANKTGQLSANPPLEGLAWLNLAHWQSDSDQKNILRASRFATLFGRGFDKDTVESGLTVGPFNSVLTDSEVADLKYVEHSGAAIAAGREDLKDIEARMEILGAQPFVERSAQSTATGKEIDSQAGQSAIQDWVRSLESGLLSAIEFVGKWSKADLSGVKIDVFNDFSAPTKMNLDFLLKATQGGQMSLETFIRELKRRGQLPEDVDPGEEAERILNEAAMQLGGVE